MEERRIGHGDVYLRCRIAATCMSIATDLDEQASGAGYTPAMHGMGGPPAAMRGAFILATGSHRG